MSETKDIIHCHRCNEPEWNYKARSPFSGWFWETYGTTKYTCPTCSDELDRMDDERN